MPLRPPPGQSKRACTQEYINANYIDGYEKARAYVGTQGPLPPTFDAFWRMVWEQRVYIVVMITNLVERGRVSVGHGVQQLSRVLTVWRSPLYHDSVAQSTVPGQCGAVHCTMTV